jgi:arylalkylamine N-acetyltransferase
VEEKERRRGVALKLLQAYQAFARCSTPSVRRLCLISHEPLVGLYEKAGFRVVGPSDVVHGKDPWIEMELAWDEE